MSTPTTPRLAQAIAFSTMISFCRASNVRSIIRISPARTCGYSSRARSSPRIAARMMWSRSRSPPRFRFIGLKRSSSVVMPLRAVRAADRGVDGALDGERRGLDQLRPVVDRVERVEVLDAARVGDGDERVELPVVLDRQRDALLVREAPHDVRRDRAAEVRVELGEPDVGRRACRESTRPSSGASRGRRPPGAARSSAGSTVCGTGCDEAEHVGAGRVERRPPPPRRTARG